MKTVILCGGLGTRLREETEVKPKPMVTISGRPILWHIMKIYAHYGHGDFVLCLGYKGNVIRDYFYHYEIQNRDFTITLGSRDIQTHGEHSETDWKVTLADTGEKTNTGGRIKRIGRYLGSGPFMATYGDGVADIDMDALLAFHQQHDKLATVTAVHPSSRFGELTIENGMVTIFREKPQVQEGWINGGFFVFERQVLDLISDDPAVNERESLEAGLLVRLAERNQLAVYQHPGFWQCMDTYREMQKLNDLWDSGRAPWAVWERSESPETAEIGLAVPLVAQNT